MNLRQALMIFWSRKTIILVVFLATIFSAAVALTFLKPQYLATAQLYVNLSDPNAATNSQVPGAVVRNYISTQVEAIRSRGTALTVVEMESLAADPAWQASFQAAANGQADIKDWIAAVLQQQLQVARQAASDIISVSYRSGSAEGAARMANAFADAFVRKDIELRANPSQGAMRWYEERLDQLRERIAEVETQRSQLRLEAIQRGDVDATGQPDPLTSLPAVLATARSGVIQAKAALEKARDGVSPPAENAELLGLRRQLSDVNLALQRETPLLGPNHRRISGLRSNAEQLQVQIDRTIQRLRAEMVAEKERELLAAERRVEEANALMSRDETQRHEQARSRATATALDRELESLRGQMDVLVQRRERASIEGAANLSNVSVLSSAAVPSAPAWPRVNLVLGVAAGMGLAFGFALAFLREMLDRRVRCQDDLTAYIDAPLLGQIKGQRLSRKMASLPALPDRAKVPGLRRGVPWLIDATPIRA